MARATGAPEVELAAAIDFAAAAYADGIITLETKRVLEEYAERTYRAAIEPSPAIGFESLSRHQDWTPLAPARHGDDSSADVTTDLTAVPATPADFPDARVIEPELPKPSGPPDGPSPATLPEPVLAEPAGPTLADRAHEWIRAFWSKLSADRGLIRT